MHCLRRVKKTISKYTALTIIILVVAMTAPAVTVGAADTETAAAGETEDAVKGHVYIRAAVEEGYEADITACLIPVSESGFVHEYRLNTGNRYGMSDDITEGCYVCVPFITDPGESASVYVEYGGGEKEVSRREDTCFLVVAGSAGFVRDYIWISDFRDENGEYLKGVVSRRDAEEAFEKTIAFQEQLPVAYDAEDDGPEEIEIAGVPGKTAAEPVPEPEAEEDGQAGAWDMPFAVAVAAAAFLTGGAAVYHIRSKH